MPAGTTRRSATGAKCWPWPRSPGLDLRAGAHDQVAQALIATGDPEAARIHWQQSLELYRQMGTPEVADIERLLKVAVG